MTLLPAKSIAVLPFVNMSSRTENEYFSDGMTEEIINALAKIKGLKVTSRTSAFSFKNKNLPIQQIGEQLKVSIILEGSVRLSGNTVRITAQLIDVAEDYHFWSETFDRAMQDIFAVQDEVSVLIADKLREHVGHFEMEDNLVERFDIGVSAYKKYLRGRFHLMKLTLPETERAISIFKEVIEEEPLFPRPYLDINQGYAYLGTMGMIPAMEAFGKAQPYLEKGIELGPELPETQLNLAWISCWNEWNLKKSYRHLTRAIDLRPSDDKYLTMSNTLSVEGKFEAAFHYIDKALELAPFSSVNHHFKGFLHYLSEDYEAAIPWFEKSLELQPELPFPHLYFGRALLMLGRLEEGLAYFEALPDSNSGDLAKLGGMTQAFIMLGRAEEAEAGMKKLKDCLDSDARGSAMSLLVVCQVQEGKLDLAMEWVEKGISEHLPNMLLLFTDPLVKSLRSEARFLELRQHTLGSEGRTETGFDPESRKYKKTLLKKDELEDYCRKLEELMSAQKPFLQPDLSLRSLAALLDIPPNYLSQLLNEGFDQNFADYVNTYRLETFKQKVADPGQRHLTILALAYDSGFNSKTVFNTFFKKKTGQTPKEYWKSALS